jgi:type IV secretory pathway TrbD component
MMSLLRNPLMAAGLLLLVVGLVALAAHSHVAGLLLLLLGLCVAVVAARANARRTRREAPGTIRLQAPR